ncbi:MAG: hypothetical protein HY565_00590 [Candidatus Kerfeldbacteria bacterium]|nr:hypothetical protein [Candidatus Kerfeldbacteria bacterium]
MESFINHGILYYVMLEDYINLSSAAFAAGLVTGLIILLISLVCLLGMFVFGFLIVLFAIIEGTSQVPIGQQRSLRKTIFCTIGFIICALVLAVLVMTYGTVLFVLT